MGSTTSKPSMGDARFGQWLKERRNTLGLTREELADRVSCSQETIYKIEVSARRPSRQVAEILAGFFSIPDDEREAFISFARGQASGVVGQGSSSREHPWRALHRRLTNLPAQVTSLVGREEDLEQVRALLSKDTARLLTLVGPPGIGKTRLAQEVATQLLEQFDEGVFFVSLASVTDPTLVAAAIAKALDVKEAANQPLLETLTQFLCDKRVLLVLDNFEQILEAGPQVGQLLAGCPWLKALITSREALHLYGERQYPVPPLEVPSSEYGVFRTEHSKRATCSSVALFVERAQAARPEFTLAEENADAVARICTYLGGLPLAIELAAARTRLFTPQAMLPMLEQSLQLLTGGARDLPPRHQTLRGALEWSYNLLDEEEQRLFRRLGVFSGGCTLVAVEAVCNARGDLLAGANIGLWSLIDKSLIQKGSQSGEADGEDRFYMLETIRDHALDMLVMEGNIEVGHVRQLHAEFFLALAEGAEPELRGVRQLEWMDKLDREHDNLRAALAWCIGGEQTQSESVSQPAGAFTHGSEWAARLASALGRFWRMRGYVTEGRQWLEAALATVDLDQPDLLKSWHLNALNLAGVMAAMQGDYERASAHVRKSLEAARRRGDKTNMARSLNSLGIIARRQGNYVLAEDYLTRCLQLYRDLGDKVWIAGVLGNLGIVAHIRGKYDDAHLLSVESMSLRRELGDKTGLAIVLGNLAGMYREHGDFAQASLLLDEAMALSQEIDNQERQLHVLAELGQLMCDQGKYDQAEPLLQRSLELAWATGEQSQVGGVLTVLGRIALHKGEHAKARVCFSEALTSHQQAHEHGADMADSLEWFALLEADQASSEGNPEGYRRATLLLGATEVRRKAMGAPLPTIKQQSHAETVEAMQAHLGEDSFCKVWAKGQALTLEEAIDHALGRAL